MKDMHTAKKPKVMAGLAEPSGLLDVTMFTYVN
jgi:hypothetical protein